MPACRPSRESGSCFSLFLSLQAKEAHTQEKQQLEVSKPDWVGAIVIVKVMVIVSDQSGYHRVQSAGQ